MGSNSTGRRRLIRLGHQQDDLCFFCDKPLRYLDPGRNYGDGRSTQDEDFASADHYIPHHQGGSGRVENTVVAHRGCNSRFGHQSKDLDEKLRLLNWKRGFGDSDGIVETSTLTDKLQWHSFGINSPALGYLCLEGNAIEGQEGVRVRKHITRRLISHIDLLNGLRPIKNVAFRRLLIEVMVKHRQSQYVYVLPQKISTLLDNVTSTMTKCNLGGQDD